MENIKVYKRKPKGFVFSVEIAAIYVSVNDQLLLLKRMTGKSESDTWGVPAGKLELHESPSDAAKRELFEETGIFSDKAISIGSLYMVKPNVSYCYHAFTLLLDATPLVVLSDEHSAYRWVSLNEAHELPLMQGAREALDFFQKQLLL